MIFKKLDKNVYHVKNVLPNNMLHQVVDEFKPRYNHWIFSKVEKTEDENYPRRGKIFKPDREIQGLGDNLTFISVGEYVKLNVEKLLQNKLKLSRVNTNIQFPGMNSSFHIDGPEGVQWTFLIFCQTKWNTIWGGEFCTQTEDGYVYVPYIPNHGCLFDCNMDHTGFPPNNLSNVPRLSLAFSFSHV